jgi:hypothetical protein
MAISVVDKFDVSAPMSPAGSILAARNAQPGAPDSPFKKNLSESCQKVRCERSQAEESVESAHLIRKTRSSVPSARPLKRVALTFVQGHRLPQS